MVKYRSVGLITPLVFDECECDVPTQIISEATPYFHAVMSGNQSVTGYGYVTVQFNTIIADTMDTYDTASYGFAAAVGDSYEIEGNISVYSATDEQVPSFIEVYDSTNSTLLARGQVSMGTVDNIAQFYVTISAKAISTAGTIIIRYLGLNACTIYAENSWFTARKLYWT